MFYWKFAPNCKVRHPRKLSSSSWSPSWLSSTARSTIVVPLAMNNRAIKNVAILSHTQHAACVDAFLIAEFPFLGHCCGSYKILILINVAGETFFFVIKTFVDSRNSSSTSCLSDTCCSLLPRTMDLPDILWRYSSSLGWNRLYISAQTSRQSKGISKQPKMSLKAFESLSCPGILFRVLKVPFVILSK